MTYYLEEAERLAREYATRDPVRIAKEMGITVLELPLAPLYGVSASLGPRRFIGIDDGLNPVQKKLVAAHELAHLVLHPEGSFFFILTKTRFYGQFEYQANMFATQLILGEEVARYGDLLKELAAGRMESFIAMLKEG